MNWLTQGIYKSASCKKGFGLIATAIVMNAAVLLGALAALHVSKSTEESFISERRGSYAEQANRNSVLIIKKLVELNLLREDPETHKWALSSNSEGSSPLWRVDSGLVSLAFCDPFKTVSVEPDGTSPNLDTCPKYNPHIALTGNVSGSPKINLSTDFHGARRNLTVLLPAPPAPTASLVINGSHSNIVRCYPNGAKTNENGGVKLSWESSNATACEVQVSGVSVASGGPVGFYKPALSTLKNTTTYTLNCTNGTTTSSDSLTITVARNTGLPANSGSGVYIHNYCDENYEYIGGVSDLNWKGYWSSIKWSDPAANWKAWKLIPGQAGTHHPDYDYIVNFSDSSHYTATSYVKPSLVCVDINGTLSNGTINYSAYSQVSCP